MKIYDLRIVLKASAARPNHEIQTQSSRCRPCAHAAFNLNSPLSTGRAATTINAVNRYTYGANLGWLNWVGDTNNGAVIGDDVCSDYIYSANVGWINLGGGSPANGIHYQNLSAGDFGDGSPANGTYDFRFRLSSDSLGNNYVGGTLPTNGVSVASGLFIVTLDFGTNVPGADRWLEIGARTNGGGGHATLSPLQALTPTPYASSR